MIKKKTFKLGYMSVIHIHPLLPLCLCIVNILYPQLMGPPRLAFKTPQLTSLFLCATGLQRTNNCTNFFLEEAYYKAEQRLVKAYQLSD